MMAGFSVDLKFLGDKQLVKAFDRLEANIQKKALRHAMRQAGKLIAEKARSLCPVNTGALRNSIKVRAKKHGRGKIGVVVMTGTREELGIPQDAKYYYPAGVELGTVRVPAHPFIRPAIEAKRKEAFRVIAQDIRQFLESEAAR